jgi:asparagine synthase (glutamine-hydrolysing)
MNAEMVHRGPDDEGLYLDDEGGCGLGARRLSIIDVEGGHQPLSNEDGSIWAVLNGEIYNHPALFERLRAGGHSFSSRADTEVLVHLYEDYGSELVHALEGMFAFAIWDAHEHRLLLGRDRFGEKPLFYVLAEGKITFASELEALRRGAARLAWEPDPRALDAFFTFGYVTGVPSVVQGVEQLEPGCTLEWHDGSASIRRYWSPPQLPQRDITPRIELVEEAEELLAASVRSRMLSDVPLGVFLSGGIDSTLVAALAARHAAGALETFTVAYDAGSVGEAEAARRAASLVGSVHHELTLSQADVAAHVPSYLADGDGPIGDQAFVALRALAAFARPRVTVAVGGEGADELFGGYPRYRWLARAEQLPSWLPRSHAASAARLLASIAGGSRLARLADVLEPVTPLERHVNWVTAGRPDLRERLYGPRLAERVDEQPVSTLESVVLSPHNGSVGGVFMHLDQIRWLPDDILVKADRATMRASLEFRTPFLDRSVAEFAAGISPALHFREGGKYLLRRVLERVLPGAAHGRRKVAFRTPAAEWLRGPLRNPFSEQLDSGALYEEGWLDRRAASAIASEHFEGSRDWSSLLWPVFALGCWLEGFRGRAT